MTTHTYMPPVPEIATIFGEECGTLGATSVDCVQDADRLFGRAVLGSTQFVRIGDPISAGVALRVLGPEVQVHPYTLRQVCLNGAIAPQVIGTRRVERIATEAATVAATFTGAFEDELRQAIRAAADHLHLSQSLDHMRDLMEVDAQTAVAVLIQMTRIASLSPDALLTILDQHATASDPSAYGLVNAVTSVARESDNPSQRWELERIGGELIARAPSFQRPMPRSAEILVSA